MRRFTSIGFVCTSRPHTDTSPEVGGMKPVIMRMVVDLPAPFGPRKPSTSPLPTSKETPSTARLGPKDLLRFSTLIKLSLQSAVPDRLTLRCGSSLPPPAEPDSSLIEPPDEPKCISLFKDLRFQPLRDGLIISPSISRQRIAE